MTDDAKKTEPAPEPSQALKNAPKRKPKSKSDFPEFDLADQVAERSADELPRETGEEVGGQDGPEPTRYGDWEKAGIATDF